MDRNDGAKREGNAIWFRRAKQPVSGSRLGGLPSLPSDVEWPINRQTKAPLHFLGQIDLSALPPLPFPGDSHGPVLPDGMLFFFMALGTNMSPPIPSGVANDRAMRLNWDRANSRVLYSPTVGPDRAAPEALPMIFMLEMEEHPAATFPGAPLAAYLVDLDQPPDALLAAIEKATGETAPILDGSIPHTAWPTDVPSYCIWRRPGARDRAHVDLLRMFGKPNAHPPDPSFAYPRLEEPSLAKAEGRHLLMQFTDDNLGELLSCESVIQFWIMPDDLRQCRFHRAWGTLEAY